MQRNTGAIPDACIILHPETGENIGFHKVHVTLRNGWTSHATGPWPAAGGRPPTRWSLLAHPFDILEWEIAR